MNMRRNGWRALCALVALLLAAAPAGCSDAQLSLAPPAQPAPKDNRLTITSDVCLDLPGEVVFPVKVAFVIDTSTSMEISDPIDPMQPDLSLASGRARAVTRVLDSFRDQPGFEVALIKFGASANVLTSCGASKEPCFVPNTTANRGALQSAVYELNVASGTTDYQSGVDVAFQLISSDLKRGDAVSLSRSRYLVIFLSDGLPFPQTADSNNPATIGGVVNNLLLLRAAYGVGDIRLHTALLATDKPDFIRAQEEVVLKAMAQRGRGLYRSYENGESINFLAFGLTSLRRAFTLKSFLAVPLHSVPQGGLRSALPPGARAGDLPGASLSDGGQSGGLLVDSDGDGLADEVERALGTSTTDADTDRDGFSDLLEHRFRASGFDPLNPGDADCGQKDDKLDDDGDGVRNCEERFLGTSRSVVDSDGDGLPDGVELRAGTDPTARDVINDTDQDGTNNLIEVLAHTDPLRPDAANRSVVAQRYDRDDLAPQGSGAESERPCFQIITDNVQLLQTRPGGVYPAARDSLGGWSRVLLWAGEVPYDDDNDRGTWRVACVQGRFFDNGDKYPPEGRLVVPRAAFRPAGPDVLDSLPCIGPSP